jgi:hypothetical protein
MGNPNKMQMGNPNKNPGNPNKKQLTSGIKL